MHFNNSNNDDDTTTTTTTATAAAAATTTTTCICCPVCLHFDVWIRSTEWWRLLEVRDKRCRIPLTQFRCSMFLRHSRRLLDMCIVDAFSIVLSAYTAVGGGILVLLAAEAHVPCRSHWSFHICFPTLPHILKLVTRSAVLLEHCIRSVGRLGVLQKHQQAKQSGAVKVDSLRGWILASMSGKISKCRNVLCKLFAYVMCLECTDCEVKIEKTFNPARWPFFITFSCCLFVVYIGK